MVERYTWYMFVVFDLYHAAYDFQTAHLSSASQPPVTVLFYGRPKDKVDALASCHHVFRLPSLDDISPKLQKMAGCVNFALQLTHGNHGWIRRPFFLHDHANNVFSFDGRVPKRPRPIPF
ncbi:hypothetical protein Sste5346_004851 [Sporothrix stenoceras]|uniref:Uncharacterized protein n=1 Tax=Sporothrix stenoceras TaxID=5173 RepID=A0ABR3Z7Q3_9PEZI